MKDGVSQRMYLVATIFTLVTFSVFNAVITWAHNTALWASRHGTIGLLEHIVQTGVVIWEAFVEVLNGKPYTTSVLQRLHVVKG